MKTAQPDSIEPSPGNGEWTTVIRPVSGWFDVDLAEIWRYRDLIRLFVWRDLVAVYRQTILGPLWYVLQPLMTTVVFVVVFGKIARVPTGGMPPAIFYLCGLVAWRYFSDCLTKTAGTFIGNAGLFGKVYFPRLAIPLSIVIGSLVTLLIQLALLLCFCLYYYLGPAGIHPRASFLLLLPLLVVQMAGLGLGCGIIVSALTTRYRDLTQLVGFGMQLWMYATPIVYPASLIPARQQWLLAANPMAPVIEAFRCAFLGVGTVSIPALLNAAVLTLLILALGLVLFSRMEKTFMDTV